MRVFPDLEAFLAAAGESLGCSDWLTVDQQRIDGFAEVTGDHQWIHVDPVRAADGPFGTTIAHGFLTLALLPPLWAGLYRIEGVRMGVNYGLNKVRFPAPVPVGSAIRVNASIGTVTDLGEGVVAAELRSVIEIQGKDKPACVAESLVRYFR